MTEQVPSKDLVEELRGPDEGGYITASRALAADEIQRLRTTLRGIQSCSTCEVCRGAATLALAGGRLVEPSPSIRELVESAYKDGYGELPSGDDDFSARTLELMRRLSLPPGDGQ